jgi:hypothetical protein
MVGRLADKGRVFLVIPPEPVRRCSDALFSDGRAGFWRGVAYRAGETACPTIEFTFGHYVFGRSWADLARTTIFAVAFFFCSGRWCWPDAEGSRFLRVR